MSITCFVENHCNAIKFFINLSSGKQRLEACFIHRAFQSVSSEHKCNLLSLHDSIIRVQHYNMTEGFKVLMANPVYKKLAYLYDINKFQTPNNIHNNISATLLQDKIR